MFQKHREVSILNMTDLYEILRQVPLFTKLDDDQFKFVEWGKFLQLQAGETLVEEGDPPSCFWVVLEGEIDVAKRVSQGELSWTVFEPQTYFGHEPILLNMPCRATARAALTSWLFELKTEAFWRTLKLCPSITRELLVSTAKRTQHFDSFWQNTRKSIDVDTLIVGLAGELNDPVSLCSQVSQQLRDTVEVLQTTTLKLSQPKITNLKQHFLADWVRYLGDHATATIPFQLDPLTRSEREEEVAEWLETYGVVESWKFASAIVGKGIDLERLDEIIKSLNSELIGEFMIWLEGTLAGIELINQTDRSINRISKLVESVKVSPGQAPLQEIDLHESIEGVVTFLSPKIQPNVLITRKYDPSLPSLHGCIGELNQVWFNLIDNAITAVSEQGQGKVLVQTCCENDQVIIEIADNGPGIPSEFQPYIFEPFFTTKEVGKGTGLGLYIAHRIVVKIHQGTIDIFSEPGFTSFQVRLPMTVQN